VDVPRGETWKGGPGGYILWLGRFDPEHKGLDVLLEAMRRLTPGERPELRLHGPDWRDQKARVAGMVQRLALGDSVRIEPPVYGEDKHRVLVEALGFVYPSRWDACPNSVLESISLGLPTLATPYPLGQYLHDRGGSFLSDTTPESLAAGLLRLTSNEAPGVGRRGAEIARTELTWDNSARAWLEQVQALG
jgi:glycosyltransferase involved in cell wall biosynthesis